MTRKFILNTLLPYKENPSLCAFIKTDHLCMYLTEDGKKCAVGRYLKEGEHQQCRANVVELFKEYPPKDILTEEAFNQYIPTNVWLLMQRYHDKTATNHSVNDIVAELENETGFKFDELR